MKKMMLCLLLIVLMLAGCSETESFIETNTLSETTAEQVSDEKEEMLDAEIKNYDGYTVNIALAGNWE